MSRRGYRIHPQARGQSSATGGELFEGVYVIENAEGVRGEPVVVAGTYPTREDALAAAIVAGEKVLDQVQ
jgi:hypothetical protein